ncbi:MAG: ESPR-type extended signal peptide-containing protein [Negativicoccus succinicivorans]|uniref:ESPR-type extended signal peptide-containing protein n=1 Tax=Negativicoccus succinicivorans TaxID=620903 RepID=UPI002914D460|nr:ESPR-type extended signal peptide-containing protein [Negativicoccus succinicivorans]MDU5371916.1 ESPR-type extended signal peptide-containing protein [Negativicoccus succinicivorans]MDU5399671.1 ESPR-type extended signal peptide-containing protein [Negativicoccus succinicivorans]
MNKIYKLVWNRVTNSWVAASEVAKSHGKSSRARGRVTLVAAVLGVLMATALPTFGVYAAGLTAEQQVIYNAVMEKLEADKTVVHYFSVNSTDNDAGSNYKNDGAKGKGAVAIGEKAMASKGGTVSIGRNAHIEGNGGNADGEGSVAIGDNALITTNGLDLASIALGKNAKVLNGSGKQERVLSFMPDNYTNGNLPDNADKSAGGIAIGTNSYARTGSIQLGHHTFAGYKMGGIDVTNANEEANIVGMTTVGTNTYNKGALANMYGAYSIITGGFTGAGGWNSLSYGSQNFGANVVGSLNSIRSKGHSGSSGIANSIVGVANTVENANGTLVYGAGNKVTNSIKSIRTPSTLTGSPTWDEMVESLQKGIKDSNSGGAVLAIGGGNVADYVRHSQLVGVNNTVTGTENKVSEFNMVNGYQNTATNITHVTMIGSDNAVKDTTGAVLLGDKRKLTGADGSIVLGSADESAETNVKNATVIGHNANTTVESGVALGSDSVADRGKADAASVYLNDKKGVKETVKGDLAAVSVGNDKATRQITGVAAGTENTDAVNVAQLRAVEEIAKTKTKIEAGDNITVTPDKKNGTYTLSATNTYTTGGTYDATTKKLTFTRNDKQTYYVDLTDFVGNVTDTRNTIVDSDTVTVEAKAQEDGSNEYTLNVKTDGKIEKDNKGIVTGGTVYNETRIEKDGNYIKAENTAGQNLTVLDKQVNVNTTNITNLTNSVHNLGNRVDRVGAGAAALAALHPLDFDPDDKWDFAAGYGNYSGANAVAIGAYYRPNEDTMFSVGGSFGGGENMVNAGVSVKLGQGNHVSTSRVAMAKDMLDMQKRMAEMEAQMAKLQGFIGALTGADAQAAMFPDVPENHWAYEYVKGLCEQGIVEGYPDGTFAGDRSMTRYEIAAVLYRALSKGVSLDARAVKEFAPELARIRVDVVTKDKEGQPVIERVRVNEEKQAK